MANSVDLDQLANLSGSTLFAKHGISLFSRTRAKKIMLYVQGDMLVTILLYTYILLYIFMVATNSRFFLQDSSR